MITSPSNQVLIVGCGPTGLALACHCLRLGLAIRLIDKQPGPSTTSKAIGLQYRVSEVLAFMGVVDRFFAHGGSPINVHMYASGRLLLELTFRGVGHTSGRDAFAPRPIMIPQSGTEALLGELVRERGGHIEWNTEFLDFEQDAEGVISRLRHGEGGEERVRSAWLVSCEGAHSVIRKQAGMSLTGKTYPLAFFMADVELDWAKDREANHVWVHSDGMIAAFPLPTGLRTWRLMIEMTRQMDQLQGAVTLDVIRQLMAQRIGDTQTGLSNPTWISEFRLHCRMVDHYRNGRVFLAGDAAHIHSPTGGQGIATGVQDVTNLAWKLARVVAGAPDRLLETYEEERLPKAREVLKETDRTTMLFIAPTRLTRLLRDYLVLPILRNGWVQRKLFSRLSQLHVHYRDSRLARHEDTKGWFSRTRVRAGDRAPDIAFQQKTLFQLLQPQRPVALIGPGTIEAARLERLLEALAQADIDAYLIARPGEEGWRNDPRCLIDVHDEWKRIYGMTGEFLCLVRPDDHIGLFQRPIREDRLRDYLGLMCSPESLARTFPDTDGMPPGPRGG